MTYTLLNDLVDYILEKFSVKATYSIIYLEKNEWEKIAYEMVAIDEFAYKKMEELNILLKNDIQLDSETTHKIRKPMEVEEEIRHDYDRTQSF